MLAKASCPTLLLTRPVAQSMRCAQSARAQLPLGQVIVAPVIDIVHRGIAIDASSYAGLIFTSVNGVDAFAASSAIRARPVWCVGTRTAAAAQTAGFVQITSAAEGGGDAEALIALLRDTSPATPLLHLRGGHARGDLAPRLSAAGLPCDAAIIYDQVACPLTEEALAALNGAAPVLIPLFSPRSATLCAEAASKARAPLYPVAISGAAARAWQALRPEAPIVAQRPDSAAMLDALSGIVEGIKG
jgi:uroporphyrinogen-III synthase